MRNIKVLDAAAFIFILVIIGVFSFSAYSIPAGNTVVYVKTSTEEFVYPIDTEGSFDYHGPLGVTKVVMKAGEIRVIASPCPEKICIASSPIGRPGTWLACLPNRVFIKIEGRDEEEIDAGTF